MVVYNKTISFFVFIFVFLFFVVHSDAQVNVERNFQSSAGFGEKFIVVLDVNVDEDMNLSAYGITETIPSGWKISNVFTQYQPLVSHVVDNTLSLVFMGGSVRDQNISYQVTIPANCSVGNYVFNGSVVVLNKTTNIAGDLIISFSGAFSTLKNESVKELENSNASNSNISVRLNTTNASNLNGSNLNTSNLNGSNLNTSNLNASNLNTSGIFYTSKIWIDVPSNPLINNFSAKIMVNTTVNISGFDLNVVFDDSKIKPVFCFPGNFLENAGKLTFSETNTCNNTIKFAASLTENKNTSGSGVLLEILFEIINNGSTMLNLSGTSMYPEILTINNQPVTGVVIMNKSVVVETYFNNETQPDKQSDKINEEKKIPEEKQQKQEPFDLVPFLVIAAASTLMMFLIYKLNDSIFSNKK